MGVCTRCGFKNNYCSACGELLPEGVAADRSRDIKLNEQIMWVGHHMNFFAKLRGVVKLNTTTYTVTDRKIVLTSGFFVKKSQYISLNSIEEVSYEQNIIQLMQKVGNVHIKTGDSEKILKNVYLPDELVNIIIDAMSSYKENYLNDDSPGYIAENFEKDESAKKTD